MFYHIRNTDLILSVRVTPNARRSGVEGIWNGTHLKVALTAPPVDGKANETLIDFLSDLFSIRKSAVSIQSGQTGRQKVVYLTFGNDTDARAAAQKLENII